MTTTDRAATREVAVLERRIAKGHAANELIEASRRADLVVVGCRGHGGVAGTLPGADGAAP